MTTEHALDTVSNAMIMLWRK